jgi:hypothetical protein
VLEVDPMLDELAKGNPFLLRKETVGNLDLFHVLMTSAGGTFYGNW